jgi:hypothetical protein
MDFNGEGSMKVGDKVEHVLTKDWLLVLQIVPSADRQDQKILCRTKDLKEIWFYEFEIKTL